MAQPMHSHGPGQPMHTHGPPQQQQMQPQAPVIDPEIQAAIEASFRKVDFKLGPPNNTTLLCPVHSLEKCNDCNVNFTAVNTLAKAIAQGSQEPQGVPPPPQMATPQRGQLVTKAKTEGNNHYKSNKFKEAIQSYTVATSIALSRPVWEPAGTTREEIAVNLSNRSAAQYSQHDYIGSLVDANMVITLKRQWAKGHFRKGKALLSLGQYKDAKDAVQLGLSFEPENAELLGLSSDIDAAMIKHKAAPVTLAPPASASKLTSASTDSLLT